MVREFITGWNVMQILGEGTFADVKLLVNQETGESSAMKEINLAEHPDAREAVRKEICIHKMLTHPNIVRCYGSRIEDNRQFIFLEYCEGGELFDRIEPEIGMPQHKAHSFFKQIIDGVEYLHKMGIAHRDIKPENLLLSDSDTIKISDFGLATLFRHKGQERMLERRCGTFPYIAPEVLMKPQYKAEPADIWSCGIVLLAMLTGELPWDKPLPDQPNFQSWKDNELHKGLWTKIDPLPLSLLKKVLCPQPAKRADIPYIKNHPWFKKKFKDKDGNLLEPELVSSPLKKCHGVTTGVAGEALCCSQPEDLFRAKKAKLLEEEGCMDKENVNHPAAPAPNNNNSQVKPNLETKDKSGKDDGKEKESEVSGVPFRHFAGFSQPAKMVNYYTATQQSTQSQSSQSSKYQRLVKRMTRFWVSSNDEKTESFLVAVLKKLGYNIDTRTKGLYTIKTMDRYGCVLSFKCTFITVENRILLDFRLSRGCGLEFKKHFAKIKTNCTDIVEKAPILWPALIPMDALPGC